MAIMIDRGFWPSTAAILTASSSEGMDSRMSTTRITRVSTLPPKAPASRPSSAPPSSPRLVDTTPMISDTRAPHTSWLSRSEPNESRPSGCPGDGPGTSAGVTSLIHSLVAGSYGAMTGAKTATSTKAATMTAPMIALGLRRSRRKAPCHRLVPRSSSERVRHQLGERLRAHRLRGHSRPPLQAAPGPGVRGTGLGAARLPERRKLHQWRLSARDPAPDGPKLAIGGVLRSSGPAGPPRRRVRQNGPIIASSVSGR